MGKETGRNRKKSTGWKGKRLLAALLAALLLTGCGAMASMDQKSDAASPQAAPNVYNTNGAYGSSTWTGASAEYPEEEYEEKSGDTETTGAQAASQAQSGERKLIKTVDMEVETRQFDDLLSTIGSTVHEMGGYIQNQNTYNGSAYSHYRPVKSASLVIRIPKDRLEEFLGKVSDVGNVIRYSDNVEDVTLAYVDLESHRNALRTEQDRLLELLKKAESLEDILTIESRLSELRYQLEGMESRLRTYDNQVEYSTVTMDVSEVQELTPVAQQTDLERIAEGFMESVRDIIDTVKEAGIWFLVHLPYVIVWALVILLAVLLFKARRRKKAAKAQAAGDGQTKEEQTPDKASDKISDKTPDKASDKISDKTPDKT